MSLLLNAKNFAEGLGNNARSPISLNKARKNVGFVEETT
jgi:hypothetical protein